MNDNQRSMQTNNPAPSLHRNGHSPQRPFGVTLLIGMVLIFTSLNILRMITAIRSWNLLTSVSKDVPTLYLVIMGAVWGTVGIITATGLFSGKKWALPVTRTAVILYSGYYWLDRLVVADRFVIAHRWQFALGLNILLLIFAIWCLAHPKTKAFLKK
jgi:hypothetical protein